MKRNLRIFIGVVLGVVLFSAISLYLIDFMSDKTWLSAYILGCGLNPWESVLKENERLPVQMAVRRYCSEILGIEVHDVKIKNWGMRFSGCGCSSGEVMVLISKKDKAKIIDKGFKEKRRINVYSDLIWKRQIPPCV